jgi:hypothetical protein
MEVHDEALKVIRLLCTNPNYFWTIIYMGDMPDNKVKFSWDMIF